MADIKCDFCQRLLRDNDEVYAGIVSKYKALPSKVHYAIEKPKDILTIRHFPDCYQEDK